jgi:hypothetical protein
MDIEVYNEVIPASVSEGSGAVSRFVAGSEL